jgi:hypothetical protein
VKNIDTILAATATSEVDMLTEANRLFASVPDNQYMNEIALWLTNKTGRSQGHNEENSGRGGEGYSR